MVWFIVDDRNLMLFGAKAIIVNIFNIKRAVKPS